MRSSVRTLVAVVASLLVAPQLAAADDVQDQLRQMQARLSELEEKLQATDDQLEAANQRVEQQQVLIERANLDGDRSASSALSRFLEQTVFEGFVAASYNYNFNKPDDDANSGPSTTFGPNRGILGITAPLHNNANTFQLDQLWFSMSKQATAESRGGFGADIVFGAAADVLRNSSSAGRFPDDIEDFDDETGDLPHVYQAYASYLAPIGPGLEFRAGRFQTVIGAEEFRQDRNFNITRGILWAVQPENHTGVLMLGDCGDCGFDFAAGVANNNGNSMFETDNLKTFLGRVRWTGETLSLAVNGLIGGDAPPTHWLGVYGPGVGRDDDYTALVDVVATWDPTEDLSMWLNFDYFWFDEDTLPEFNLWGLAAAGRLALTEATGVSIRGEFLQGQDLDPIGGITDDANLWSITGTIDHALTDNLTLRLEGRYDRFQADGVSDDMFIDKDEWRKQDQGLALVELMYRF